MGPSAPHVLRSYISGLLTSVLKSSLNVPWGREWYARSGCSRRGMVENAVYRCPHFVTRYPALETNAVSTIPHARSTTTTVMGKSRIIARLVRS